jgi:hypothetical protein
VVYRTVSHRLFGTMARYPRPKSSAMGMKSGYGWEEAAGRNRAGHQEVRVESLRIARAARPAHPLGSLLGRPLSALLLGTSASALTRNMASIPPIRFHLPIHVVLMSFPSPVWSFFGPKNRIWSRECSRSPVLRGWRLESGGLLCLEAAAIEPAAGRWTHLQQDASEPAYSENRSAARTAISIARSTAPAFCSSTILSPTVRCAITPQTQPAANP